MGFERDRLPDPRSHYEAQGLVLSKGKKWVTTACQFHQGRDSMRINLQSGAFVCMAGCGARGGDVLAYHMAVHGLEFIEAAKDLGAWVDDGKQPPTAPAPFTPRQALEVLMTEVHLIAVVAGNIGRGVVLSETERTRLLQAAGRVLRIAEVYA
ncbi:CHC2 zinc finger domain-containing protein [Delftia tsuruhatensis]|uniref:CHC2 zinc finger domain-containing protein n=1 Tax=Delftia tsuruhatensis TaxID=180282 RepID=UPI0030D5591A